MKVQRRVSHLFNLIIVFLASHAWKSEMSKDKYEEEFIKATNIVKDEKAEDNYKPARSDWGRNAFSMRMSCSFCGEVIKKSYNYALHLKIQHKSESPESLQAALADAEHYRLDGCEYQCKLCLKKFLQTSTFMRHTSHHGMTFKQYVGMYMYSLTHVLCATCTV